MSEIKAKIQESLKTAMKARDQHTLLTLRGLTAAIKQFEVDSRTEADDARVTAILQKEIKMRRDALTFAESQQRQDLIDQNQAEVKILQGFLGEQMSEEELKTIISGLVASGADNMGKIMGALNKDYKGKFEGKVASEIAKQCLPQA